MAPLLCFRVQRTLLFTAALSVSDCAPECHRPFAFCGETLLPGSSASDDVDEAAGEQPGPAVPLQRAFEPAVLSLPVHKHDVSFFQFQLCLALRRIRHHHPVPAKKTTRGAVRHLPYTGNGASLIGRRRSTFHIEWAARPGAETGERSRAGEEEEQWEHNRRGGCSSDERTPGLRRSTATKRPRRRLRRARARGS